MKRKTYNNVLKAGTLIQANGYSEKESLLLRHVLPRSKNF